MRADDLVPGSINPNGKRICDLDDEYICELLSEYPTDCDDKSNDSSNEDTNSDEDSDRNDSSKEDTNRLKLFRKKLKNWYNHFIDFF